VKKSEKEFGFSADVGIKERKGRVHEVLLVWEMTLLQKGT
jgi:hypothetical protein